MNTLSPGILSHRIFPGLRLQALDPTKSARLGGYNRGQPGRDGSQVRRWIGLVACVLSVLAASCASADRPTPGATDRQPTQARTLILAHRYEPPTLAPKVLASNGPLSTTRLFNASLALFDDGGN